MKHAALLALAVLAVAAAADAPPEAQIPVVPFTELQPGEGAGCADPGGCVAMTKDALRALLREAIQRARAGCGKEI